VRYDIADYMRLPGTVVVDHTVAGPMTARLIAQCGPERRIQVHTVLNRAALCDEAADYELTLAGKGGRRVKIRLHATARRDARGKAVGVIGVGQTTAAPRLAPVELAEGAAAAPDGHMNDGGGRAPSRDIGTDPHAPPGGDEHRRDDSDDDQGRLSTRTPGARLTGSAPWAPPLSMTRHGAHEDAGTDAIKGESPDGARTRGRKGKRRRTSWAAHRRPDPNPPGPRARPLPCSGGAAFAAALRPPPPPRGVRP